MEEGNRMRRFFGVLAFLSFFWLYGTIGAVEQNILSPWHRDNSHGLSLDLFLCVLQIGRSLLPHAEKEKPLPV
jgi:hypothetical protein